MVLHPREAVETGQGVAWLGIGRQGCQQPEVVGDRVLKSPGLAIRPPGAFPRKFVVSLRECRICPITLGKPVVERMVRKVELQDQHPYHPMDHEHSQCPIGQRSPV